MIEFKNNQLIIAPNNLKNKLILEKEKKKGLVNSKIINREEFIKNCLFDYDTESILFLMEKYKLKIDISNTILESLYYVDKKYNNKKIDHLFDIKEDLINNNLLKYNPLYKLFLKDKDILVVGYKIDKLFYMCLKDYNYSEHKLDIEYDNNVIYEAESDLDEIDFIFNKIGDLITDGIDINRIKIVNFRDSYDNIIKRFANFYNLPIENKGYSIFSNEIVGVFLNYLWESKSISKTMEYIIDNYNTDEYSKIIKVLLDLSNKYILYEDKYEFNNIYELINQEVKKYKIVFDEPLNKIEIYKFNNLIFDKDDYVFLIGFNQGEIPKLYKDEDYLNDKEKELIDKETSIENNIRSKEEVIDFIKHTNNLTITYPLKHLADDCFPSFIIEELKLEVKKIEKSNNNYSEIYSKIKLSEYLDDFIKYGVKNKELEKYYSNYDIDYLSYDNKFKGIKKDDLLKVLDNKLLLSYSSINNYNKCSFRYYLSNILKVDSFDETFQINIGSLFHYLLQKSFDNDFDLDKEWNDYTSTLDLCSKDKVLLIRLKEEFKDILSYIRDFHKETGLTKTMLEEKILIDKSIKNIDIKFMGVIDKLMYKDNLIALVDYKTGNTNISIDKVPYGIDMQLPIYWYLVKKSNLFDNPRFVGFYLEKILSGNINIDSKKSYEDIKKDNLKLVGYSTDDMDRLEVFDPTFENSNYVKGMKLTKDGSFSKNTKILNDEELDNLVDTIDEIIDKNRDDIIDAKFDINPKEFKGVNIGCEYCNYKDICFMKNEDVVCLGGDLNA